MNHMLYLREELRQTDKMEATKHDKRKRGKRPAILSASEKKRRRKEMTDIYHKSRVIIGPEIIRWRELKEEIGVRIDAQMAAILLDR